MMAGKIIILFAFSQESLIWNLLCPKLSVQKIINSEPL